MPRLTPEQVARLDPFGVKWRESREDVKFGGVLLHYEGEFNDWYPHPKGILIVNGNQFLLNGRILIYQGERSKDYDKYVCDHRTNGLVIRKGKELILDGKEVIYSGEFDNYTYVRNHLVIIRKSKAYLMMNGGERFLGDIPEKRNSYDFGDYQITSEGVVVARDRQIWLNGVTLLYAGVWDTWEYWEKREGVVIEKDKTLFLNGEESIGALGREARWRIHPLGIFTAESIGGPLGESAYKLCLNDRTLCTVRINYTPGKGLDFDPHYGTPWKMHPAGVIFRTGADWMYYGYE